MKTLIAFILAATLPQMSAACAQLSENVWLCDRGSQWEAAEWDTASDGSTLINGALVLNFTEHWPGFEITDDLSTLQEQFTTYSEWIAADGEAPLEVYQTDLLDIESGEALRSIERNQIDGSETLSAIMLVQVSASRIMIFLDGPVGMDVREMDAASREVLSLLKDNCADPVSCAADYIRPSASIERG
ncbi:MAG: hypothetical protein WBB25_08995 [Sulfitobacter sp.]